MGFIQRAKHALGLESPLEALGRKAQEMQVETSMMNAGWKIYPGNATDDEKAEAIENCLNGGKIEWYPPRYEEPPIIREGKLKI